MVHFLTCWHGACVMLYAPAFSIPPRTLYGCFHHAFIMLPRVFPGTFIRSKVLSWCFHWALIALSWWGMRFHGASDGFSYIWFFQNAAVVLSWGFFVCALMVLPWDSHEKLAWGFRGSFMMLSVVLSFCCQGYFMRFPWYIQKVPSLRCHSAFVAVYALTWCSHGTFRVFSWRFHCDFVCGMCALTAISWYFNRLWLCFHAWHFFFHGMIFQGLSWCFLSLLWCFRGVVVGATMVRSRNFIAIPLSPKALSWTPIPPSMTPTRLSSWCCIRFHGDFT